MQAAMVVATVLLFLCLNAFNEWLFIKLEFASGINWVFLPAGMRLLATLLFGTAGFIGLLIASLLLNFYHFAFEDPVRAVIGAVAGSLGAYLVYLVAARRYGLQASLANLTPKRLLWMVLLCSMANPLLHHLVFIFEGRTEGLLSSYFAMFVGDLVGTLIVIYTMKLVLTLLPSSDRVKHKPMLMTVYRFLKLA
jgi:hypothetical protein